MKETYIKMACDEAIKAFNDDEVPVGAVIVKDGKVIAKAYNKKEKNKCVLEHAELLALKKASKKIKNWRLNECEIFVTLEPCPMCASALKQARVQKVYYLSNSSNINNSLIVKQIFESVDGNPKVKMTKLQSDEFDLLLKKFFKKKRDKN